MDTMLHVHYIAAKLEKSLVVSEHAKKNLERALSAPFKNKQTKTAGERDCQLGVVFLLCLYLKVLRHPLWGLLQFRLACPWLLSLWLRRPENLHFLPGLRGCWSADHTLRTTELVHSGLHLRLGQVCERIRVSSPTPEGLTQEGWARSSESLLSFEEAALAGSRSANTFPKLAWWLCWRGTFLQRSFTLLGLSSRSTVHLASFTPTIFDF